MSTPENVQKLNTLHSIINSLLVFKSLVNAEQSIKENRNQKIFIIVDGDVGLPLILSTHTRSQTAAIYVYSQDVQRLRLLLQPIKKGKDKSIRVQIVCPFQVQYITDDFDAIVKHLKKDLRAYEKTANGSFITKYGYSPDMLQLDHYYLMLHWSKFYNIDTSNEGKRLLFETYTNYYKHNKRMREILQKFNLNIGPNTAIQWYTSEPFISRLLNTAFQTHNFVFLNNVRYFIHCIHLQLRNEHSGFVRNQLHKPIFSIYCGRLMTTIEFKRLKMYRNKVILITSFLMGNLDKSKAIQCINRCEPSGNETRVLLKINIDARIRNTQPYADITHLSNEHNENEILIMFGASFRLMDVIVSPYHTLPVCVFELCAERPQLMPPNAREQRWYSLLEPFESKK
ncbi:unnamed protein product [Rotaria socialis]|uniref:Uncharacterized protein n=1 Tax=Rotaria socialis TaxID=392032 RepID=A0A818URQ1_9BILA|nr:unnamed protein product [Rotaria socialis]